MVISNVGNWINGNERPSLSGEWFEKLNPATGQILYRVASSNAKDVSSAVEAAKLAQPNWADTPAVQRGMLLHKLVVEMQKHQDDIASIVSHETGKSIKDALGETGAAIQCGLFYASEGQRLYGRTTTSGSPNKYAMTIRQPIGIAGLIIAANTPIANVAWKIFPALICGNSAILKASEDTPATAWYIGKLAKDAGLPDGVLNIIQGFGERAGAPLVENQEVGVISFTGSTEVGRFIQRAAGERFARISLELGGKNPFIVCDDADLENAVKWILLSAFSNAGQRCASTSRIIIFDSVYEKVRDMLVTSAKELKVGTSNESDFGPVINESQLLNMVEALNKSKENGAVILTGGHRLLDDDHRDGYYLSPTLIENIHPHDPISENELFGPIAILFRVKNFDEALTLANDTPYGLTASIHTKNLHRAVRFYDKIQAGVAVVNAGTHGSEPHMPFGGRKLSGNGSREPGTEALNIYSELKDVYINIDQSQL